jgi:hypothetical protein
MRTRLNARSLVGIAVLLAACGRAAPGRAPETAPPAPFPADTFRTEVLGPGVTHRFIYVRRGPWAINVLDVDLGRCLSAVAVKGAPGAVGRERTSRLLQSLGRTQDVVGGVNADFFSLVAPQGVPTGLLVSAGRVITGPAAQPVLAFDSRGAPHIVTLTVRGRAVIGTQQFTITGWNHAVMDGVALFDANWNDVTDTASSAVEIVLAGRNPSRVVGIDTAKAGVRIPADGFVLVAGRNAAAPVRAAFLSLRSGDVVRADVALEPMQPREAVGGRPLLVRDSLVPDVVDTEGQPGFATGRHPRTAAGISRNGGHLILTVVDGRQMPYSDGMTLRELANLMLALGARDAINLDGGGSTTLVHVPRDSAGTLRVANRPSDTAGERAVGDALAIVRTCKVR